MHGLVLWLLIARLAMPMPPQSLLRILPVELVTLSDSTGSESTGASSLNTAGPRQRKQSSPARGARQATGLAQTAPNIKPGPAPAETEPPPDALQKKLEALSRLRQSDAVSLSPDRAGPSAANVAGNGARLGPSGGYTVKDFVRAQVERRWNLDLALLKNRDVAISIHVVMTRDGAIKKADIVDQSRFRSDAAYHSLALSARNAVLLSSPVSLPAGHYDAVMDMTLDLNPRDLLR